jgi:hypothetical protein
MSTPIQIAAPDLRFHGSWVGETQEGEMPAHLWEITQIGKRLHIQTRWEGEEKSALFTAQVVEGGFELTLSRAMAILVDAQHFIIPGWDTNDARNHEGPDYDVVFSRPGLAELTAQAVWLRWRAKGAKARKRESQHP